MSDSSRATFFRQSGWMFLSNLMNGIIMFAVHPVFYPRLGEKLYGEFSTVLQMLTLLAIPALGLQTVFAQRTAAVMTPEQGRELAAATRRFLRWTFYLWLAMTGLILLGMNGIVERYTLSSVNVLGLIIVVALAQLWVPIGQGLLTGSQNFLWLGWSTLVNGAGRFSSMFLITTIFGASILGVTNGVMVGTVCCLLLLFWQSRSLWRQAPEETAFPARSWLLQVVPLSLALGASQLMFLMDTFVVRDLFGDHQTGAYGFAQRLGQGIVLFTAPLGAVMFPKIVHSTTRGSQSSALTYTLLGTLLLGVFAAVCCSLAAWGIHHLATTSHPPAWVPGIVLEKFISPQRDVQANTLLIARLLPWFVWGMLPLALANVLIGNLLARQQYRAVPWLLGVAAAYFLVLYATGTSFQRVVYLLGGFNILFLAVLGFFTWRGKAGQTR